MKLVGRSRLLLPLSRTGVLCSAAPSCMYITSVRYAKHSMKGWVDPTVEKFGDSYSFFSHMKPPAPDIVQQTQQSYLADLATHPDCLYLGAGILRDGSGSPWRSSSIQTALNDLRNEPSDFDYSSAVFQGLPKFLELSPQLIFSTPFLQAKNVATVQTLSSTGALRLGSEFLSRHLTFKPQVHVSDPTDANYYPIFSHLGVKKYRFFDSRSLELDFEGMLQDIKDAPARSVFVFQPTGHNPTGLTVGKEHWKEIGAAVRERKHICIFDLAFQGVCSGCPYEDAWVVRYFAEELKQQILVAQSFSYNMGLYEDRIGALHVVTHKQEETEVVSDLLGALVRQWYSHAPSLGARVVAKVLATEELKIEWLANVKEMANMVEDARKQLYKELVHTHGSKRYWEHLVRQKGIFCYTGLEPHQVQLLRSNHRVFLNMDGGMVISALPAHKIKEFARFLHEIVK